MSASLLTCFLSLSSFGNCVELQASSAFNWNDQRCKTLNRYICLHGKASSGTRWMKVLRGQRSSSLFVQMTTQCDLVVLTTEFYKCDVENKDNNRNSE